MTDEQTQGVIGAATRLGDRLLTSLPAQFLALVLMTGLFNLGILWFVDRENAQRERIMSSVLSPILSSCMTQVPADVMRQLLEQHNTDQRK